LTDTANEDRSLGAVVKPGKRNPVGRRTADWRHCRADIRSDLSEGVKAISSNRGDEKQTPNLDHEFLLLHSLGERDISKHAPIDRIAPIFSAFHGGLHSNGGIRMGYPKDRFWPIQDICQRPQSTHSRRTAFEQQTVDE
jgi:hypothetical protein